MPHKEKGQFHDKERCFCSCASRWRPSLRASRNRVCCSIFRATTGFRPTTRAATPRRISGMMRSRCSRWSQGAVSPVRRSGESLLLGCRQYICPARHALFLLARARGWWGRRRFPSFAPVTATTPVGTWCGCASTTTASPASTPFVTDINLGRTRVSYAMPAFSQARGMGAPGAGLGRKPRAFVST